LNESAGVSKKYIIIQKDKADTICKLRPVWKKFRDDESRLYCLKKKALYDSKDASQLWYKDMSGTLKGLEFVANPYDPCVFNLSNKKTGENLITIGLHVDDLLVPAVDDKLLDWLQNKLVDK
jgi:Reverse transcriptase (RNA-dependent DNA polymerase)